MTERERKDFLAQFKKSRREIARWPKWMRDAAVEARASFPTNKQK
jgi:hypothetical protein